MAGLQHGRPAPPEADPAAAVEGRPELARHGLQVRAEELAAPADAVITHSGDRAAPLAYRAGPKGKMLASLAAGVPCACTPVAAEGLSLPAPLSEQVGASPEEVAIAVLRLREDPALNAACRAVGLAFVEAFASEDNVDGLMREAVSGLGRP